MQINYNLTGIKRKELVSAVSQELNAPVKYLGMPTAAYEVGGYIIDKNGTLKGEDNPGLVADLQGLYGFITVSAEYDTPIICEENIEFENLLMDGHEELELGRAHFEDWQGESGMQSNDVPEPSSLTIEMPLTGFTLDKLDNLAKLVAAKASLIKTALGTDDLSIQQTEDTLRFPWFKGEYTSDEVKAYTHFVTALCEMAKRQKRVTVAEKPSDFEKYTFRCFLLRLGLIGPEYKTERKILLSKLSGSSAYKQERNLQSER